MADENLVNDYRIFCPGWVGPGGLEAYKQVPFFSHSGRFLLHPWHIGVIFGAKAGRFVGCHIGQD